MERSTENPIDIIRSEEALTIPGLLFERAARDPNRTGFVEFKEDRWTETTWRQIAKKVGRFRAALEKSGMRAGDRAALWLPNSTDWVAFDIAAMANGLITVPLYMHDSPSNVFSILENSGARLCFIDEPGKWQDLAPFARGIDSLDHVWLRSGSNSGNNDGGCEVKGLSEVLANDGLVTGETKCGPDDVATIIYTSGTTGTPKGVMLSHRALLWNAESITKFIPPTKCDVFISVLPAAHAFERTMGYHLPIMCGSRIAFARSIDTLQEDLRSLRPTVLTAVPRLYERFHAGIMDGIDKSPIKKALTHLTANIGWSLFEANQGRGQLPGVFKRHVLWPILQRMVGSRVLEAFGGRIRVAVSGGAPLPEHISHFLIGLGLPLLEGYGLTETAPVVTAASFDDNEPGSVGRPLEGVEIRVSDEGELLIRSPSMMNGYWQDPERTAAVLDPKGWLKTGDLAEIRNGRVFIQGRLVDTIVLSTAKKVAPSEIEAKLQRDPLFDQVCVLGTNRPCLVALVVLNPEAWNDLALDAGLETNEPNHPVAKAEFLKRVAAATVDLPPFSQVRALHASLRPWAVEDGALTPTLKVRRHEIAARYKSEIDELFQEMELQKKSAGGSPLGVGGVERQNRSKPTKRNLSGQK